MKSKKTVAKDARSRFGIPKEITVDIDSREKLPIKFPSTIKIVHPERPLERLLVKVKTQKVKLPYGDYRLAEYPDCCVIERKAGQRELLKNMFNPRDAVRQAKSFRGLSQYEFPYILIELTPEQILRHTAYVRDPEALMHRLSMVFVKYGLHVLWMPWRTRRTTYTRRQLGVFLAHLMLSCALFKTFDTLPEVLE
jgi:ERCC4-type nuclease